MEHVDKLKAWLAALFAVLTALWGWFGWLVILWVFLMALDYYTGSRGARRRGEWSSKIAREGIAHKGGEVKVFLVALVVDAMMGIVLENFPLLPFQYSVLFSPLVVVWYILTEAGSILENVAKDGTPLPTWVMKLIQWLKGTVDQVGDTAAGEKDNPGNSESKFEK